LQPPWTRARCDGKSPLLVLLLALAATAHADPRTSGSYTIAADTADAGGKRAISASYTNDGSAGGIVGISTVAAPAETAKHGYIGQLYDVTGLTLTAATLNVNETATVQLGAWQALDDSTFLAVAATSVAWSVASGPLTGISTGGLATAGIVYQNTAATAQGIYLGNTGTLGLTVVNSLPDNFGSYAGDGIDDAWQNQYFGLNNPLAGPLLDPDGDGQANLFEFTAGLVPTNPASRFSITIAPVPGQPGRKNIIFNPLVLTGGRSYTVKFRPDLATGAWAPLTGTTQSDTGAQRTVTDLNATGAKKFYEVEITKP
jgi:hypothetical protein